jgi:hypothetical protein
MNFDEFAWHDSILKNIEIDRKNPGNIDTILLEIEWYDDTFNKILFEGVYWTKLTMNFGIISAESIDIDFIAERSDSDLINLYNKWADYEKANANYQNNIEKYRSI